MAKPKILICDDEENMRNSLALFFDENYAVSFARDGFEAINYITDNEVSLVFLDIKMANFDGLEVLKKIKGIKPELKVIMVTGWQSRDHIQRAKELGAYDYIVKPFEKIKVQKLIKDTLG